MAELLFTQNLARHTECPTSAYPAATVAELLEKHFGDWPDVRGFVLDDQGEVRKHVKILVDGQNLRDRKRQSCGLTAASRVHVFQALSAGRQLGANQRFSAARLLRSIRRMSAGDPEHNTRPNQDHDDGKGSICL